MGKLFEGLTNKSVDYGDGKPQVMNAADAAREEGSSRHPLVSFKGPAPMVRLASGTDPNDADAPKMDAMVKGNAAAGPPPLIGHDTPKVNNIPFRRAAIEQPEALTTKGNALRALLLGGMGAAAGAGARTVGEGFGRGSQVLPTMQHQNMQMRQGQSQLDTQAQQRQQSAALHPLQIQGAETDIAGKQQSQEFAASNQAFNESHREQQFQTQQEGAQAEVDLKKAHADYYKNPRLSPGQVFADAMRSGDPEEIAKAIEHLRQYTSATTKTQPETGNHAKDRATKSRSGLIVNTILGKHGKNYDAALADVAKLQPQSPEDMQAILEAREAIAREKQKMVGNAKPAKPDPIGDLLRQKFSGANQDAPQLK